MVGVGGGLVWLFSATKSADAKKRAAVVPRPVFTRARRSQILYFGVKALSGADKSTLVPPFGPRGKRSPDRPMFYSSRPKALELSARFPRVVELRIFCALHMVNAIFVCNVVLILRWRFSCNGKSFTRCSLRPVLYKRGT